MRLNKFIASATGVSRREADVLIESHRVLVNGEAPAIGRAINEADDIVAIDGRIVKLPSKFTTVILNKPVGYVCSRNAQAQGVKTIYDLLPDKYKKLKSVGRLDKDSSGLILLTDDGDLAYQMTHPKFYKTKVYIVELNRPLAPLHQQMISDFGINLDDGPSKMLLVSLNDSRTKFEVTMHEGRNRQIRRTFAALGYTVTKLHRTQFDNYQLGDLKPGAWKETSALK